MHKDTRAQGHKTQEDDKTQAEDKDKDKPTFCQSCLWEIQVIRNSLFAFSDSDTIFKKNEQGVKRVFWVRLEVVSSRGVYVG